MCRLRVELLNNSSVRLLQITLRKSNHTAINTMAGVDFEYCPEPRWISLHRPGSHLAQRRRNSQEVFDFSKSRISRIYLMVLTTPFFARKCNYGMKGVDQINDTISRFQRNARNLSEESRRDRTAMAHRAADSSQLSTTRRGVSGSATGLYKRSAPDMAILAYVKVAWRGALFQPQKTGCSFPRSSGKTSMRRGGC